MHSYQLIDEKISSKNVEKKPVVNYTYHIDLLMGKGIDEHIQGRITSFLDDKDYRALRSIREISGTPKVAPYRCSDSKKAFNWVMRYPRTAWQIDRFCWEIAKADSLFDVPTAKWRYCCAVSCFLPAVVVNVVTCPIATVAGGCGFFKGSIRDGMGRYRVDKTGIMLISPKEAVEALGMQRK